MKAAVSKRGYRIIGNERDFAGLSRQSVAVVKALTPINDSAGLFSKESRQYLINCVSYPYLNQLASVIRLRFKASVYLYASLARFTFIAPLTLFSNHAFVSRLISYEGLFTGVLSSLGMFPPVTPSRSVYPFAHEFSYEPIFLIPSVSVSRLVDMLRLKIRLSLTLEAYGALFVSTSFCLSEGDCKRHERP